METFSQVSLLSFQPTSLPAGVEMKRRARRLSLAVLIPSFLHRPNRRASQLPPTREPSPNPFSLIDDDPFADLSCPPSPVRSLTHSEFSTSLPSTPTSENYPDVSSPVPRHGRTLSMIPHSSTERSKACLPSLSSLQNVRVYSPGTRSVVAARLPYEPWDIPEDSHNQSSHVGPSSQHGGFTRSDGPVQRTEDPQISYFDSDSDYGFDPPKKGSDGDRDGDDPNHPRQQSADSTESSSSSSSESDVPESRQRSQAQGSDDSDDVPLAQRIPTALRAQHTLRRQNRDQQDQRRRERASTRSATSNGPSQVQRSRTLHSTVPENGVIADDLTRRLLEIQSLPIQSSASRSPESRSPLQPFPHDPQGLHLIGSLHRSPRRSEEPQVKRSHEPNTNSSPRLRLLSEHHPAATPSRSRTMSERPSLAQVSPRPRPETVASRPPMPPFPVPFPQVGHMQQPNGSEPPSSSKPLLSNSTSQPSKPHSSNFTNRRIFISDRQKFATVRVDATTRAKDVLDIVAAEGLLKGEEDRAGNWMLWQLEHDFGMERPIREFELVAEVSASRNAESQMNAFMIRKTPLAASLAQSAIPSASPTYGGYVEWEQKRGKWTKRWLGLREQSIFVSKREHAKETTHLCSLSNFDVYHVSRVHKSPKPFVFAIKSTDDITLFENPADHVHVFCCDTQSGMLWFERILVARSYVLHHERTILFRDPSQPSTSNGNSPSITRVPTKKNPNPRALMPPSPLINVDTLIARPSPTGPFAAGSLLAGAKSLPFQEQ